MYKIFDTDAVLSGAGAGVGRWFQFDLQRQSAPFPALRSLRSKVCMTMSVKVKINMYDKNY